MKYVFNIVDFKNSLVLERGIYLRVIILEKTQLTWSISDF